MIDHEDLVKVEGDDLEIEAEEGFMVDVQVYLHEIMVHRCVSRAELARRMGVSRAHASNMFSEDCNLTVRQLARAAFHLGGFPKLGSATTRELRAERESAHVDAAAHTSGNVLPLWRDVSAANPADVTCAGDDAGAAASKVAAHGPTRLAARPTGRHDTCLRSSAR